MLVMSFMLHTPICTRIKWGLRGLIQFFNSHFCLHFQGFIDMYLNLAGFEGTTKLKDITVQLCSLFDALNCQVGIAWIKIVSLCLESSMDQINFFCQDRLYITLLSLRGHQMMSYPGFLTSTYKYSAFSLAMLIWYGFELVGYTLGKSRKHMSDW